MAENPLDCVDMEIKISTPTVEAHYSKMKALGIIENVEPIFNIDRIKEFRF